MHPSASPSPSRRRSRTVASPRCCDTTICTGIRLILVTTLTLTCGPVSGFQAGTGRHVPVPLRSTRVKIAGSRQPSFSGATTGRSRGSAGTGSAGKPSTRHTKTAAFTTFAHPRKRESQLYASTAIPRSFKDATHSGLHSSSSSSAQEENGQGDNHAQHFLFPWLAGNHHHRNEDGRTGSPKSTMTTGSNTHWAPSTLQKRQDEWARKYCSIQGLRDTFGYNRNALLGDLDAQTARRLYKALLPSALMELYNLNNNNNNSGTHGGTTECVANPEDLAYMAYQARVAAKLYARERCRVPSRVAANLYDGFRQWKRYGRFNTHGMTYEQIWDKYAALILSEDEEQSDENDCRNFGGRAASSSSSCSINEDDVTARICFKILERSCQTNAVIDNMFLSNTTDDKDKKSSSKDNVIHTKKKGSTSSAVQQKEQEELRMVRATLERDVRDLLNGPATTKTSPLSSSSTSGTTTTTATTTAAAAAAGNTGMSPHRLRTLRTLVRIKRRLEGYHDTSKAKEEEEVLEIAALVRADADSLRQRKKQQKAQRNRRRGPIPIHPAMVSFLATLERDS